MLTIHRKVQFGRRDLKLIDPKTKMIIYYNFFSAGEENSVLIHHSPSSLDRIKDFFLICSFFMKIFFKIIILAFRLLPQIYTFFRIVSIWYDCIVVQLL